MRFLSKPEAPPTGEQLERMRREAWSSKTSPERLAQIIGRVGWGEKVDQRILDGVARNPSSPPAVLAQVVNYAPQSFCRNPAVPLLAIADPGFCGSLPAEGLALVLRSPNASPLLVAQAKGLSGYWLSRVAEDAAWHISQRPEIPDTEWAAEIRRYWEGAMARIQEPEEYEELYGYSPADTLWEQIELGLVPSTVAGACALKDPLPTYTFDGFRSRFDAKEGRAMDRGLKKPPRGPLEEYPEDEVLLRYLGAVFSPEADVEDLAQWAEKHAWLALAAAQHPNLAPTAWKRLVGHYHPGVRRLMLRRPDLPPELRDHARTGVLKRAVRAYLERATGPEFMLARFVAQLHAPDPVRRPFWRSYTYSHQWQDRLAAAVAISPRPNGRPPRARHTMLLERLAQDGNVLVRAAARARLRGEHFAW